jgi:hypothetical protein
MEYRQRDGKGVLEDQHVALVFDDLSDAEQRCFHFNDGKQSVQVRGNGTANASVSCRKNATLVVFSSSYTNGTNTIQLGKSSVSIIEGGKALLVKGNRIDLAGGRKTVFVSNGVFGQD